MLEAIMKHGILFYVMGITMGIGILAKLVSYITVRKMVKAAGEIQKSNHKLMRLIKAKFEHATMVSDRVQNVEVFVKKYLYEYKVLGVRLETWRGLQKKMIWLLAAIGFMGTLASYWQRGMAEQTFQYLSWTGVFVVLLFVLQVLSDEVTKLEAAKNYIVDYLENVCVHRYEKMNQTVAEEEKTEKTEKTEEKQDLGPSKEKIEQELRIRAILEEFLA